MKTLPTLMLSFYLKIYKWNFNTKSHTCVYNIYVACCVTSREIKPYGDVLHLT